MTLFSLKSPTAAIVVLATIFGSTTLSQESKSQNKQWYKGNLHTHSLWSDGNDFPEMICDWYQRNGYQFLALSDHNILSNDAANWIDPDVAAKRGAIGALERYQERFGKEWVELRKQPNGTMVRLKTLDEFRGKFEKPGKFLLVQSEEITDHVGPLPVHINATNIGELIRPQGGESVQDAIRRNLQAVVRQEKQLGRPIVAHLNHPNFGYAVTAEDIAAVVEERYFEVFNGHPSVNQKGDEQHASIERIWDIVNTLRIAQMKKPPLYGLATDDSHKYFGTQGSSPGRGWVMVRAAELTANSITQSLKSGDFYSSTGVQLKSVVFDGKQLNVEIDAIEGVEYTTYFIGTRKGYDPTRRPVLDKEGNELNVTGLYAESVGEVLAKVEGPRAAYKLSGDEYYVRARVESSQAPENPVWEDQTTKAWTQPFGISY
jgi:hypothetical protein